MKAIADSEGKVQIALRAPDGTEVSFKVGGIDGRVFTPGTEVEIPDERLEGAIAKLTRPFGAGPWERLWESTAT